LRARLTAQRASATFRILEKERLKFLYVPFGEDFGAKMLGEPR